MGWGSPQFAKRANALMQAAFSSTLADRGPAISRIRGEFLVFGRSLVAVDGKMSAWKAENGSFRATRYVRIQLVN